MGAYGRGQLVQTLVRLGKQDADTRAVLLTLFAAPEVQVRQAALEALKKSPITPEEARRLEGLLERRSHSLRQDATAFLATREDARALGSCARLLAAPASQRRAGLELLHRLPEAGRRLPECRARAEVYQAQHPNLTDEERETLAPLLRPDRKLPSLNDA